MYLPLVTPETPLPDIYFQRVLYLDLGRDSKGHLGLLFEGGREVDINVLVRPERTAGSGAQRPTCRTLSAFRRVFFHRVCETENRVRDDVGSWKSR